MKPKNMSAARYAALMGLLFALAGALNTLENLLSAFLPAGMRVGLSNIVIMAAILCINLPSAAVLVILKAMLVLLTRGFTAGIMSLCGSMAAFLVTALLFRRTRCSYILKRTGGYCSLGWTALRRGGDSRYCVHLCICACACFCFRWHGYLYGNCA